MTDTQGEVIQLLKDMTQHEAIKLTNSGNAAIFASLYLAKIINPKPVILIPDQGGWISYKTYPEILGFEVIELKTDHGVIDITDVDKKCENASAIIVPSFAGYFAENDIKAIKDVCKNDCLVIEDASSGIGDEELCDGKVSDIIVASFGKGKVVDLGYGGFLSAKKKGWLENNPEIFSMFKHNIDMEKLKNKLLTVDKRLHMLHEKAKNIKKDLNSYDIIHKNGRGVNVCVLYKGENEKEQIIEYCKKNNLEYVQCPKNIRVEEDAISIEVKRL